jgi:hypothetical protein
LQSAKHVNKKQLGIEIELNQEFAQEQLFNQQAGAQASLFWLCNATVCGLALALVRR